MAELFDEDSEFRGKTPEELRTMAAEAKQRAAEARIRAASAREKIGGAPSENTLTSVTRAPESSQESPMEETQRMLREARERIQRMNEDKHE